MTKAIRNWRSAATVTHTGPSRIKSGVSRCNDRGNPPSGSEYATPEDFRHGFKTGMPDLLRLAFLLTANADKTEDCIILAMRECISNEAVPREHLRVWTRRAVVRHAIRLVSGMKDETAGQIQESERVEALNNAHQIAIDIYDKSLPILELGDFKRIVYVLSVLEQYSIRDCALLVGRSQQNVRAALTLASALIAMYNQTCQTQSNFSDSASPAPALRGGYDELNDLCGTLLC